MYFTLNLLHSNPCSLLKVTDIRLDWNPRHCRNTQATRIMFPTTSDKGLCFLFPSLGKI